MANREEGALLKNTRAVLFSHVLAQRPAGDRDGPDVTSLRQVGGLTNSRSGGMYQTCGTAAVVEKSARPRAGFRILHLLPGWALGGVRAARARQHGEAADPIAACATCPPTSRRRDLQAFLSTIENLRIRKCGSISARAALV